MRLAASSDLLPLPAYNQTLQKLASRSKQQQKYPCNGVNCVMAVEIEFTSDFHRELYTRAPKNDEAQRQEVWKSFCERHPEWGAFTESWLSSRRDGSGPLQLGIPWVNYPAISFLDRFLPEKSSAFEWGMGGSTIYLRKRLATVLSVEHDEKWYGAALSTIRASSLRNDSALQRLIHRKRASRCMFIPPEAVSSAEAEHQSGQKGAEGLSFANYVNAIKRWPDQFFDVVIVDGRARTSCCRVAARKIRPGGALVFDNSDYARYQPDIHSLEKNELKGWARQDFLGPGPCSVFIGWRTTVWSRPTPQS